MNELTPDPMAVSRSRSGAARTSVIKVSQAEKKAILKKRAEEKEAADLADKQVRFENALKACAGGRKVTPVAFEYSVNATTLRLHHNAAQQGKSIQMGRNPLLSDIAIAKIIKEVQMGDLGKNSLDGDDDWNEFIKAKIIEHGEPGHKPTNIPLDPKTVRHYRDKIAPHVVKKGYSQNQSRKDALGDIYQQLAFAIVLRSWLGYWTSISPLGRDEGQEPPLRKAKFFYNIDGSSTFAGQPQPPKLHLAEGSQELLAQQGLSASSTKKRGAPPVQARSIKYLVLASLDAFLRCVIIFRDRSFDKASIKLFPCPARAQFYLVLVGEGASPKAVAKRILTEIILPAIHEDIEAKKAREASGPVLAMVPPEPMETIDTDLASLIDEDADMEDDQEEEVEDEEDMDVDFSVTIQKRKTKDKNK
jgi:hypothetical protein